MKISQQGFDLWGGGGGCRGEERRITKWPPTGLDDEKISGI